MTIQLCMIDSTAFAGPLQNVLALMAPDIHCTCFVSMPKNPEDFDIILVTGAMGHGASSIKDMRKNGLQIPIIGMSVSPWRKGSMILAGADAFWSKSGRHEDVKILVALIQELTHPS